MSKHKQYKAPHTLSLNAMVRLVDPSQVHLNWTERWHLDYFRKCTVVQCMDYFEDPFWGRMVHQMCEEHPAVRHAAIAMGARQRQFEEVQTKQIKDGESLLALSHSSKAIACLQSSLSREQSNRIHKETVLVTCVILTMLALFQEDMFAARCHFLSGYRLLEEWLAVDYERSPNGQTLKQAFAQVHTHFLTCEDPRKFVEDKVLITPGIAEIRKMIKSPGIDEYKRDSHFLMVIGWQLVRSHPGGGFSIGPATLPIGRGEISVLSKIRLWRNQLKCVLKNGDILQRHRDMLNVLELWSVVLNINLAVASNPEHLEVLFDDHTAHFERAVGFAKILLRFGSEKVPLPETPTKISVVNALLWCGVKSRDWSVRKDIVSLLNLCKHQDPWIRAATAAFQRMIEIESNGVKQGDIIPQDMDQDTSHNKVTADVSTSTIFESLDTNTRCLLKVLLFFNPVSIPLALFAVSNRSNFSRELGFWRNKSRISSTMKALGALLNLAFIETNRLAHNHD
ncbi:unnamed protein product [Penicillium glandicola]